MKNLNLIKASVMIFLILLSAGSCKEDEGFTQVTQFERNINNALNDHRATMGKQPMVLQFLLMDDAQIYSAKMANESVAFGIEGVMDDLETQKVLLAADSAAAWVAYCEYENPDSVLSLVLRDPDTKAKIEGYFNQSAVGTAKDALGNYYITGLLLHF